MDGRGRRAPACESLGQFAVSYPPRKRGWETVTVCIFLAYSLSPELMIFYQMFQLNFF